MAIPDLVFPDLTDDRVVQIWEAIKTILRTDTNLKTVRSLKLWEGNPDDAYPPTAAEMPWVRVTPVGSPMRWGDEASFKVNLTFKYELAVEGTNVSNLIRLYGAFRKALSINKLVGDDPVLKVLQDSGAIIHEFQSAAIGPLKLRDVEPNPTTGFSPIQNLASVGTFLVAAYIPAIV